MTIQYAIKYSARDDQYEDQASRNHTPNCKLKWSQDDSKIPDIYYTVCSDGNDLRINQPH